MTERADTPSMWVDPLTTCLATEHAAVEALVYKLDQQHLLLASGQHRWLPRATAEVEQAVADLQASTRAREEAARSAAAAAGLPAMVDLGAIVDALPEGAERAALAARQQTMRSLVDQLGGSLSRNRELLARGMAATSDALALLGTTPSYDATGAVCGASGGARLVDARA